MEKTLFKLQIVDLAGNVVKLPAGGQLEIDFVDAVCKYASEQGIGLFRTTNQVKKALEDASYQVIDELKRKTVQVV